MSKNPPTVNTPGWRTDGEGIERIRFLLDDPRVARTRAAAWGQRFPTGP